MALDESAAGNLGGQRQVLGVCWIAYGIFRLILGICLFVYAGTATVMFGALLGRVPDAFTMMAEFHVVYAVVVVLSFVCGLIGLLAGRALWRIEGRGGSWRWLRQFCRYPIFRLEPRLGSSLLSTCFRLAAAQYSGEPENTNRHVVDKDAVERV